MELSQIQGTWHDPLNPDWDAITARRGKLVKDIVGKIRESYNQYQGGQKIHIPDLWAYLSMYEYYKRSGQVPAECALPADTLKKLYQITKEI